MQIGRGLNRRMAIDCSSRASLVPRAPGASFLPQLQLAECEVTASGPVIEDFLIAGGPGVVKTRPAYPPGEPAVGLARGKTQVAGRYLEQCRLLIDPGSNFAGERHSQFPGFQDYAAGDILRLQQRSRTRRWHRFRWFRQRACWVRDSARSRSTRRFRSEPE